MGQAFGPASASTPALTAIDGGNWKVVYTDGSGNVTELALGTANTVLTSAGTSSPPTFTLPGRVLLEQHTASNSATLDFTSISSAYDEYQFDMIDIVPATDDTVPYLQAGTGAGPTYDTGGNYGWTGWRWLSSGSGTSGASSGATSITLALAIHKAANWPPMSGSVRLFNPQSATYKVITGQFSTFDTAANLPLGTVLTASYQSTTAITGIRFIMSSGNITSGTVRMYGVAK